MGTKTTTTKTDTSEEDRQRVQGNEDDYGGGSGSMMGPVDWQRQQSVNFPCFQVATSNTISSLSSLSLILILFSSDSFSPFRCIKYYQYCNHAEKNLVQSVQYPSVCTPYIQESKNNLRSCNQ